MTTAEEFPIEDTVCAWVPHGRFVGVPGAGHNNLYLSVQGQVAGELRAFFSAK